MAATAQPARPRKGPNAAKIKEHSENLSKRRIAADQVDNGALIDLYELHRQRLILEEERAREARELLNHEWQVPLPEEYSDEDRVAYGADASWKYLIPLQTTQRLAAKRCRIMRPPAGISRAAQKASTGVEVFANGLMDELFPWHAWVENLQNEGCAAVKVIPSPAHYEDVPTLYSEDEADHLDDDGYEALEDRRKPEYERFEDDERGPRWKRVSARYRVNKDGDEDDGSDKWEYDRDEARSFFEEERDAAIANNPPVVMEILSRLDFVPINPRFTGKGSVEIDGIVSRRLFARDTLRAKGYKCLALTDAMQPVGPEGGKDGDLYLYEAILKDHRGHVFIAYQVAGQHTTKHNGTSDEVAVIDLTEQYGLTRIPVVFRYGWHWSTSDPARRSIPFTQPYAADWRNRDVLVTATTISAMWSSMPAYGQRITPDGSPAAALAGDVDLDIKIRPNTISPIYGDLVRLGGEGVGKDVPMLIQMFEASAGQYAPQPGAFGGEGPTSGIDRQTQGAQMELAHSHILEGARSGYEEAASLGLEICTALGKLPGKPPVSLNVMSTTPTAQPGPQSPTRSRVTLSPRACGDNWSVIAEYPHQPGENLAAAAQWQSFAQGEDPLILREEFRSLAMGDPSPEVFEAKRLLQRWLDTEAGMTFMMEQVTESLADEKLKSILELQNQGRMTAGQVSTAAMADINPMGGGGAANVAPQVGNPANSAYAGAVQGATQASVGQAASPVGGLPAVA